jgi:hypothetical protein
MVNLKWICEPLIKDIGYKVVNNKVVGRIESYNFGINHVNIQSHLKNSKF